MIHVAMALNRASLLIVALVGTVLLTIPSLARAQSAQSDHSKRVDDQQLEYATVLHVGMRVYTTDDGEGNSTTQTVCPTAATYNALVFNNSRSRCFQVKYGSPAIVKAIIKVGKVNPDLGQPPDVLLESTDRSWLGITAAAGLQPDIPVSSIVKMAAKDGPLTLSTCPLASCTERTIDLAGPLSVKVLRYAPRNRRARNLYVKVMEGKYKGQVGWMYSADLAKIYGPEVGPYGLDYSRWSSKSEESQK